VGSGVLVSDMDVRQPPRGASQVSVGGMLDSTQYDAATSIRGAPTLTGDRGKCP